MNAKAWLLMGGLVAAPAAWAQHDHHVAPAPAASPGTPVPALTEADRAAAMPPAHDHPVHDNGIFSYVLVDRLEAWSADPGTGIAWSVQGWVGTDLDRLWVRSEGERVDGRLHGADVELLYGRSVSPWWDVVAGVRHDAIPGAPRDFVAVGVQGLAPGKFEVAATGYLGAGGQAAARFEAEYETLLTNRLVLQPRFEADAYARDDERRGTGAGLATTAFGLRLRYEVTRRFAPYVGVERERAHGRTAALSRAEGEGAADTRWVAGFRAWF
jgi:copper resistance protein B